MKLRAIVVDDEALGREGVELAIAELADKQPEVEIVASCASASEALQALRALRPDLLLLDIQMPEMDGFELLDGLEPEELPPAIVFVTAHDTHAIRAFEVSALDYVLKPLVPRRMHDALVRAARRVEEARALVAADSASWQQESDGMAAPPVRQLVSRGRDGIVIVEVDEIEWIQADAYNVWLHLGDRAVVLRERMHVLERLLDPAHFLRVHRSAMVRLDRVREVTTRSQYEWTVVMRSGAKVPMSRSRRAKLEQALVARR